MYCNGGGAAEGRGDFYCRYNVVSLLASKLLCKHLPPSEPKTRGEFLPAEVKTIGDG